MSKAKILIMDTKNNSARKLNLLLKKRDFKTKIVYSKNQFYKKINDFKPEMIILSDSIQNTVGMIWDSYIKKTDMPRCILITNNHFSKREKEILFDILNVIDFINPNSNIDELTSKIQKNLS